MARQVAHRAKSKKQKIIIRRRQLSAGEQAMAGQAKTRKDKSTKREKFFGRRLTGSSGYK
jgi:hypothetical protein